jgi:hypothetical protein
MVGVAVGFFPVPVSANLTYVVFSGISLILDSGKYFIKL